MLIAKLVILPVVILVFFVRVYCDTASSFED